MLPPPVDDEDVWEDADESAPTERALSAGVANHDPPLHPPHPNTFLNDGWWSSTRTPNPGVITAHPPGRRRRAGLTAGRRVDRRDPRRKRSTASADGDCSEREASDVETRWIGPRALRADPGGPGVGGGLRAARGAGQRGLPQPQAAPDAVSTTRRSTRSPSSIREVGILQPIVVRKAGAGYELIAGERRLRAAKLAGLATIPVVVRDTDDADTLREALIENIHREDLGPIELAEAFRQLLEELGLKQEELADRVGVSRSHIANTIRLLQLPHRRPAAADGREAPGRPCPGARCPSATPRRRTRWRSAPSAEDLPSATWRTWSGATWTARRRRPRRRPSPEPTADRHPTMAEVEEILSEQLATRVQIQMGKKRGRVMIEFGSRRRPRSDRVGDHRLRPRPRARLTAAASPVTDVSAYRCRSEPVLSARPQTEDAITEHPASDHPGGLRGHREEATSRSSRGRRSPRAPTACRPRRRSRRRG